MAIPAVYIIDKCGVRWAITTGLLMYSIGTFVTLLITENFFYTVVGQGIAGCGLPIILGAQGMVCDSWFNIKERPLVVS